MPSLANIYALRSAVVALMTVMSWEHLILLPDELSTWAKIGRALVPHRRIRTLRNSKADAVLARTSRARSSASLSAGRTLNADGQPVASPRLLDHAAPPPPSQATGATLNGGDIAVLLLRYSNVGFVVATGTLLFGRPSDCTATASALFAFFIFSSFLVHFFFMLRVYLIWSRARWILFLLMPLVLLDLAFWTLNALAFSVVKYTVAAPTPHCGFPLAVVQRFTVTLDYPTFAIRLTFETLVLVLTLVRIGTLPNTSSSAVLLPPTSDENSRSSIARAKNATKRFFLTIAMLVLPRSLRVSILLKYTAPDTSSLQKHERRRSVEQRGALLLARSQAETARAYLLRSNFVYYVTCFAVTLVAYLLYCYATDVYLGVIGIYFDMSLVPVIAVRVLLNTPSRNEERHARRRRQQTQGQQHDGRASVARPLSTPPAGSWDAPMRQSTVPVSVRLHPREGQLDDRPSGGGQRGGGSLERRKAPDLEAGSPSLHFVADWNGGSLPATPGSTAMAQGWASETAEVERFVGLASSTEKGVLG